MQQITLSIGSAGLCNQLFSLVTGILTALKHKRQRACIGPFWTNVDSTTTVPISKIIDLTRTGDNIGIFLFDGPQKSPSSFRWYTIDPKFSEILSKICFKEIFYDIAEKLLQKHVDMTKPLHVIHMRIELDGIKHWARINKMSIEEYTKILYEKYRKALIEFVPKDEQVLILTFDTRNELVLELSEQYNVITLDTTNIIKEIGLEGREVCAIIDLLLGTYCSGTFIGCHNFVHKRGSSFSFVLWKLMKNAKKGIFIDLDQINTGLQIC